MLMLIGCFPYTGVAFQWDRFIDKTQLLVAPLLHSERCATTKRKRKFTERFYCPACLINNDNNILASSIAGFPLYYYPCFIFNRQGSCFCNGTIPFSSDYVVRSF